MKKVLAAVLCFVPFVNQAQQNWGKGLSIEISGFQATANRVHGDFETRARPGFGVALVKRFPVCQKWAIETGIGFTQFNPQFTFYRLAGEPGTENYSWRLNASLNYLRIPFLATYSHSLTPKSALNFSAGINARVLVAQKDIEYGNFMWNDIEYLQSYNRLPIISPQLALGYNYALKDNSSIRLEFFAGRDINRFERKYWKYGVEPGRLYYAGLNLRYTFGRSIRQMPKSEKQP